MGLDFKEVAAAALASWATLLPEWLGGKRVGREWQGETRSNGGLGNSWSVNLDTGKWMHGAGDERGLDLVSLYAALHHIDQLPALKEVAAQCGVTEGPPRTDLLPRSAPASREAPAERIPIDAPPLSPHKHYGEPTAVYRYGDSFWIARYDTPEGKQFSPFTWRGGRWHAKAYPDPRPIYGAELLAKHPTAPVLIVEGEKCADIARATLRAYVVITWAGGAQSVKKNDWTPLAGRDVVIWPDADEPGAKAAATLAQILLGSSERVRVLTPDDHTDGWDIADAVVSGMDARAITKWATEHIKTISAPKPAPDQELITRHEAQQTADEDYPASTAPKSSIVTWQEMGLATDSKNVPHATLSNASTILQRHQQFHGKIWLDSFRGKVFHTLAGVPKLWTDADSRSVTAWIQQQLQLPKINLALIEEAVQHAAECNARNSLTDWLDSLEWDRVPRLDTWLFDCLGAVRNPYNDAVARNWPISMVARAYSPGCQVDTMPVLEGRMGRGKSSFLKILADPWFAAIQIAFGEKDFFQAIQGRWLIEIPDMSGFSRREHTQILATITTRVDVYRKSHGRITEEHPRVTVFAATSESDEYLQDSRGRRRYWPLRCGNIELETLVEQREQIFAEAVHAYRGGDHWYEMPKETDEEQSDRASRDIWTDRVLGYAEAYGDNKLTSATILEHALEMSADRWDQGHQRRIYRIMRENGWYQLHGRNDRYWKKLPTEDT